MDWKGHMSLDWTTKTDAAGRFSWDSAPSEPLLLTLTKPGFVMLGQREFVADKAEQTLTMYPPLRVRGKVTDARTGRPVSGSRWCTATTIGFSIGTARCVR